MELDDGYLTIQAVRSHSNDEKDKKGRYLRHESFSGTCARSFYVGDVKKEDIHAKFEMCIRDSHNTKQGRMRHDKVHNLFGYNMTRAAGEAFERLEPDKRILMYSRSLPIYFNIKT